MNKWIKKSIGIANAPRYLDKLSKIYVMKVNPERPLPKSLEQQVRQALKKRATKTLIKLLLKAAVFPVKDSYIGFIKIKEKAIDQNPKTIKRIGERLYKLGVKRLLQEATRPKETNRQLGSAFRRWVPSLGYPMLSKSKFDKEQNIAFLKGSDKKLKEYAKTKLNCKLTKGIDVLFKKKGIYVIGEAKFLTTAGGEQTGGFTDASTLINNKSGRAKRIAIIDGYVWLESKKGIHDKIVNSNSDIFSALLLKKYIQTL